VVDLREDEATKALTIDASKVIGVDAGSGCLSEVFQLTHDCGVPFVAAKEKLEALLAELPGGVARRNGLPGFFRSLTDRATSGLPGEYHIALCSGSSSSVTLHRPNGRRAQMSGDEFSRKYTHISDAAVAEQKWQRAWQQAAEMCCHGPNCASGKSCSSGKRQQGRCILTGITLPFWNKIEKLGGKKAPKLHIVRAVLGGEKYVGIELPSLSAGRFEEVDPPPPRCEPAEEEEEEDDEEDDEEEEQKLATTGGDARPKAKFESDGEEDDNFA